MSVIERTANDWHFAARKVWMEQPLTTLTWILIVTTTISVWMLYIDPENARAIYGLSVLILALGSTRRMIAGDAGENRWIIIFQRPVRPLAHYARVTAITFAFVTGAVLLSWSVLAAWAHGASVDIQSQTLLVNALTWTLMLLCIGAGVSSFLHRADVEFVLLLFVVTMAFLAVKYTYPLPMVLEVVVGSLLIPIESARAIGAGMEAGDVATGEVTRVVLYSLSWLGIAAARVAYLERGNAPP